MDTDDQEAFPPRRNVVLSMGVTGLRKAGLSTKHSRSPTQPVRSAAPRYSSTSRLMAVVYSLTGSDRRGRNIPARTGARHPPRHAKPAPTSPRDRSLTPLSSPLRHLPRRKEGSPALLRMLGVPWWQRKGKRSKASEITSASQSTAANVCQAGASTSRATGLWMGRHTGAGTPHSSARSS